MIAGMRDKFVLLFLLMPISMQGQLLHGKVLTDAGAPVGFADMKYFRMKNNVAFLFSLIACIMVLAGCGDRHSKAIDTAYAIVNDSPDSALSILDHLNEHGLANNEKARYALVYTMAQDKSGLDVDNDSLLRTAYTYYCSKHKDSLYAKCQYYMGKYYMLNDSSEKAVACLQKAADAAEKQRDKYTLCLILEKLSKVIRQTNPLKAVEVAGLVEKTYASLSDASPYNIIYSKLSVCEALLFADSLQMAGKKSEEALAIAIKLKDSNVLSDVYQDMSAIERQRQDYRMCLYFSKASFNYCSSFDISKALNLATAYLDADSLSSCNTLLDSIHTDNAEYKYIIFNVRHLASIKEHDYKGARNNADSAYYHLEKMYEKQLSRKQVYYNSLVKSKYENGIAIGKTRLLSWLIVVTSIFAITIIVFILYSYKQYKTKAKIKLKAEKEKLLQEERIHNEELHHKEIQLSTMRNFILKRIDIAQKIQELKSNKTNSVLLTEEDWEEISFFVDSIEGNFVTKLQNNFPDLSEDDIRFMMLVRLKMPTKALALIYGISEKSIKQKLFVYKTKVGINGEKISLRTFIGGF